MLDEFQPHNLHWDNLARFEREDPHLSGLRGQAFVHAPDWWDELPAKEPGLYILTGGRQIGKSTSLKRLMLNRLRIPHARPVTVFYLPCDQIFDPQHFSRILRFFLDEHPSKFLLLIDEVTFVPDWDRVIKGLADEGRFRGGQCLLTGSDTVILKQAAMAFPGRRGHADKTDFHLLPLSFREYVELVSKPTCREPEKHVEQLFDLFASYRQCGGYLRAINDLHTEGAVRPATFATFEQWIRGDMLKRGKNEETLLAVFKTFCEIGVSQVSYTTLAARTHTASKETFMDYCRLLERMDVLFDLQAFDQNTRRGFPKKARKFHFCDPFIRRTIRNWLVRERFLESDEPDESGLTEACVAAQFHSRYPSYYIKANGEIDLIIVKGKNTLPIEVKWSERVRPENLAELRKFKKAVVVSKSPDADLIGDVHVLPLPLFLMRDPFDL